MTGFCILLEGTGDLNHFSCVERFNSSCPDMPYLDDEVYKSKKIFFPFFKSNKTKEKSVDLRT